MDDPLKQFLSKGKARTEPYLELIDDLLNQYERYGYAGNTLMSIKEFIEESGTITDGQIRAIQNIKNNPSKKHGRRNSY
ncbi:MAG: hypothetical protein WD883_00055 [Candidatus Colwellbacteria bacterium]